MTSIAESLGQFVAEYASRTLPQQALAHAQMVIASTLASAAAGRSIDSAVAIRPLAVARGRMAEASIWFPTRPVPKLPAELAAPVNVVASDAAASDDSDLRNIAHIGTIVASTALAPGERMLASGVEVLGAALPQKFAERNGLLASDKNPTEGEVGEVQRASRHDLVRALAPRYGQVSKHEKSQILDQAREVTGYTRNHALVTTDRFLQVMGLGTLRTDHKSVQLCRGRSHPIRCMLDGEHPL